MAIIYANDICIYISRTLCIYIVYISYVYRIYIIYAEDIISSILITNDADVNFPTLF